MNYVGGSDINIGDKVIVEGDLNGVVVCDFEKWISLKGFSSWLTKENLADGTNFSSGILIKTEELGFLYYPIEDPNIKKLGGGSN